ncbi:putative F-box domain-containing protein [Medicago truncatula]|uniref:Putative F-box domain-containing protein n=2 Tax=Medicago truncatula TaxID=3880 RepID=A0A396HV79_MEDTR|nr:putative F-box domain-containing protein [Medicago truncatula]
MERCVAAFSSKSNKQNCKVRRSQSHIPNDLSFSILSKLPIKPLKRFGCVHKSWSLLLDNPYFMTMYRYHFVTKDHSYYDNTSLLLHQTFCPSYGCHPFEETFELYSVSGSRFENKVKLDWPNIKIAPAYLGQARYDSGFRLLDSGSVHGTLYLVCAPNRNFILWNPSTKESKLIPPSPFDSGPNWYLFVDHRGFGYDSIRDDYKVICHGKVSKRNYYGEVNKEVDSYLWEIYSVRRNCWRKLDVGVHNKHKSCEREQLYIDGLSHWMCYGETRYYERYMLSFDWSNEIFLTTPIPPVSNINGCFEYFLGMIQLVLLNGSIAFIISYIETGTFHISILGELGVKESWTKIFIVGPFPCLECPIGAGKKGDMLFIKKDGELAWIDLNTQIIEDSGVITERSLCKIAIHKENLLPFGGKSI